MTEEERDEMLKDLHRGLLGTADGTVRGLRPMVDAIEARHTALDKASEGRRWRRWAEKIVHGATGAVTGWIAAHFGK